MILDNWRDRLKYSSIHFVISVCVVLMFFSLLYFLIYTPDVMHLEGGHEIAIIIFFVDVTLGPLMTFFLFLRGKKGLVMDLVLIAFIQISALFYGGWVLYTERPLYLAYVVEHFEIIPASDIDVEKLKDKSLEPNLLSGPKMVFVEPPEGDLGNDILFSALKGGKDAQFFPQLYRDFTEHLDEVVTKNTEKNWSLESVIKANPEYKGIFMAALKKQGRSGEDVLLIPVLGHLSEGTILIDRKNGNILAFVDAVIW